MYSDMVRTWRAWAGMVVPASVVLLVGGLAWSWTNEVYHAVCVPGLSCSGACVVAWQSWDGCPSGKACVGFHTFFGMGSAFKACVPSTDPSHFCNTGDEQPPFVAACSGKFFFCACRGLHSGDCENDGPPGFPCECPVREPADGLGTYRARNNCT